MPISCAIPPMTRRSPLHGPGSAIARLLTRASILPVLSLALVVFAAAARPASAAENLNGSLEEICKPLQELGTKLGASLAPGTEAAAAMQQELTLSAAQYKALWALLKLTPTSSCSRLS